MSDLLQRLKQGTKATMLVSSPWDPAQMIQIRILSQGQYQEAVFETETFFKNKKIDIYPPTAIEFENERALRLLYKSLQDPKDNSPICPDITQFRNSLSLKEVQYFLDLMLSWESECSPRVDQLSGDELDRLIEDLKKKPQQIAKELTNLHTLRKLIITLAGLLTSSQKASG